MPVTSEQMAKYLRRMNEVVSQTSDLLNGETKKQFQETSARYLDTLANRVDLQRAQDSGVTQMTRAEVEAIVGPKVDRLIERANALQQREDREAVTAARLAKRAVEVENAVRAAIALPWSNGQAEGQITKPKLVKRHMYGRGKIDLLQARLIGASPY